MGMHSRCDSTKKRNIYASKFQMIKRKKKQKYAEKNKFKFDKISPEDLDEFATGAQFRNRRFKTTASAVPISGKRKRKLFKAMKREVKHEIEAEKVKEALAVVEMKDVEQTEKKKKKKKWPKKSKKIENESPKVADDSATPMVIDEIVPNM